MSYIVITCCNSVGLWNSLQCGNSYGQLLAKRVISSFSPCGLIKLQNHLDTNVSKIPVRFESNLSLKYKYNFKCTFWMYITITLPKCSIFSNMYMYYSQRRTFFCCNLEHENVIGGFFFMCNDDFDQGFMIVLFGWKPGLCI